MKTIGLFLVLTLVISGCTNKTNSKIDVATAKLSEEAAHVNVSSYRGLTPAEKGQLANELHSINTSSLTASEKETKRRAIFNKYFKLADQRK